MTEKGRINSTDDLTELIEPVSKIKSVYLHILFYQKNIKIDSCVEVYRGDHYIPDFEEMKTRLKENLEYLAEKNGGLTTFTGIHAIGINNKTKKAEIMIVYKPTFNYIELTLPYKIRKELQILGNTLKT